MPGTDPNAAAPPWFRAGASIVDGEALERRLCAALEGVLGPGPPRARIDPAVRQYLELLGERRWDAGAVEPGLLLLPAREIAARFQRDVALYLDGAPDAWASAGCWLALAATAGGRSYYLCCDPQRAEQGSVTFGDDAHPWVEHGDGVIPFGAFGRWLDWIAAGV